MGERWPSSTWWRASAAPTRCCALRACSKRLQPPAARRAPPAARPPSLSTDRRAQEEINKNRLSVLLNLAAGHIAQKEFGAAARRCTEALALDPENIKALLRRAKAYTGRREYEARCSAAAGRTLRPPLPAFPGQAVLEPRCRSLNTLLLQRRQAAEADLVKVKDLEPWNFDAEDEAVSARKNIARDLTLADTPAAKAANGSALLGVAPTWPHSGC